MKMADRCAWIIEYLRERQVHAHYAYRVSIVDSDFVWAYVDSARVDFDPMFYGAPKCETLSRDL